MIGLALAPFGFLQFSLALLAFAPFPFALFAFAPFVAPQALDSLIVGLPHGPFAPTLRVHYAARDAGFARRLAESAAEFDPQVFEDGADDADPGAGDTLRLLVAHDEETFREATGGRLPEWGLAVAFPERRAIVMRPPRLAGGNVQDPGQVLAHELAHVYLALFLGDSEPAAPRWFHEGLASLLAGEWGWTERFELAFALVGRRPLTLESLEDGFPSGRDAAGLAYLESLTAVAFLRGLSGEEGLRVMLRNLRRTGDFDAALRRTYGLTYGELEARLRDRLVRRYGWAMLARSSWTLWAPAALLLVLVVLVRRLRYRTRLAELNREEGRDGGAGREWELPESSGEEWKGRDEGEAEGPAWDPRRGAPP